MVSLEEESTETREQRQCYHACRPEASCFLEVAGVDGCQTPVVWGKCSAPQRELANSCGITDRNPRDFLRGCLL